MEIYGHHNVYTGRDKFEKLGQIAQWRYNNVTEASPRCKLKGSTGEFHPIPLVKGRPISYFLPDLCRELQVDYYGTTLFEGVEAFVYKGSARNMANGESFIISIYSFRFQAHFRTCAFPAVNSIL